MAKNGFSGLLQGTGGWRPNMPMVMNGISMMSGAGPMPGMGLAAENLRDRQQYAQMLQQPGVLDGLTPQQQAVVRNLSPRAGMSMIAQLSSRKAADDRTAMQKNYEYFKNLDPNLTPQQYLNKGGVTIKMPPGEKAFRRELGALQAKDFKTWQEIGSKHAGNLANYQVLEDAMSNPKLYTGAGGEAVLRFKQAAQAFGVPVEGVAAGEVAESITKKLALAGKDDLPGPMSDSDRRFLMQLPPGIGKSPEGNRRLISIARLRSEWQVKRAQTASEHLMRNDGVMTPGVYGEMQKVDREYAQKMAKVTRELREGVKAMPRKLGAGFPTWKQYDSLPSGTTFVDPDGNKRRKP